MSRLFAENFESICPDTHESFEHARQKLLNLHILFDHNRDAHTVNARLYHAALLITIADNDWLGEERGVVLELDFRVNLALNDLRGKVAQIKHGLQVQPDVAQVVSHCLCHLDDSIAFIIKKEFNCLIIVDFSKRILL